MRRVKIDPREEAALEVLRVARLSWPKIAALRCNDIESLQGKVRVIYGRRRKSSGVVHLHALFIPRALAAPLLDFLAVRRGSAERDARLFSVSAGALKVRRLRAGRAS